MYRISVFSIMCSYLKLIQVLCFISFHIWTFYSEEKGILDESDQFMMDPTGFIEEFAKTWSLPSHIVLFDSQEKLLKDFLVSHHFHEVHIISILCFDHRSCKVSFF